MENYTVRTENFEGPLDLLLDLIKRDQLDITGMSLSKVADDFLSYVETNQVALGDLAQFLLVASQLILIKSKAILPLFELTEEEEEEIQDLEDRLKIYSQYKKSVEKIRIKWDDDEVYYFRPWDREFVKIDFVMPKITALDLKTSFEKLLVQIPVEENLKKEVIKEIIKLEDRIFQMRELLESRIKVAFSETVKNAKSKVDLVISFLAMLEMIKRKFVRAAQEETFGEILIEKREN